MATGVSNYPTSLDTTSNQPAHSTLAAIELDGDGTANNQHSNVHGVSDTAIVQLETKIGTGASTATANKVLRATGTGTSAWAQVGLTTDVTGTLPVANGGTGATSITDKAVLISQDSGTDTVGSVALSSSGQLLIGGTSGPAAGTITADDGLSVTVGDGTIELDLDLMSNGGLEITSDELSVAQGISQYDVAQFASGVADNDFLRVDGTAIEGRSASEVLTDISASPVAGSSSIATVGTVTTGTWQGTDVGVAYGGTGASTLTANGVVIGNGTSALSAVDMSTKGGLLAGDGSGNPSVLAVGGSDDHVLTVDSGEATGMKWAAAGGGGGITQASTWVMTSDYDPASDGTITANLAEKSSSAGRWGKIGSSLTESSGLFTFPATGIWMVSWGISVYGSGADTVMLFVMQTSNDGFSSDTNDTGRILLAKEANEEVSGYASIIMDVTNTSNDKIRFSQQSVGANITIAGAVNNNTWWEFVRLGDT
jgi:hypothetical protein